MALTPIVKVVDLYVFVVTLLNHQDTIGLPRFLFLIRYRHELFDHGFGVQWMDENDENASPVHSKQSVISVRSVFNTDGTRLPAHIWRSLTKVAPGDVVVELNGVNTSGQRVDECKRRALCFPTVRSRDEF